MIATNTITFKIKLLIIILLLISPINLSQQKESKNLHHFTETYLNINSSENTLLNRLTLQNWDGIRWTNNLRNDYSYDSLRRTHSSIAKRWSSGWINQYKYIFEWKDTNKLKKFLYMTWNGIDWDTTRQILYTYSNEDKNVEIIIQQYVSGNWINYIRTHETYNSNSDLLTSVEQYWDGTLWINFALHEYQYIAPKMLSELINSEWSNGNWVNRLRDAYTYSGSRVIEYLHQETDTQNPNVWITYYHITYLYSGNTVTSTKADWDTTQQIWWDQYRYIEVYLDPELKYLSSNTLQDWDGENNIWSPARKQTNIYDSEMNLTQSSFQHNLFLIH